MKCLWILAAVLLCACSDGNGGSNTPTDSGIVFSDWHKPLPELNNVELTAVCAYITESFARIGDPEKTQRVDCVLANRHADAAQCEQGTAQCMREATRVPRECSGDLVLSCPLLGTDLVRCVTGRWLDLKIAYDRVTCATVADERAWAALSHEWKEQPTSCEAIRAECSDLFEILK